MKVVMHYSKSMFGALALGALASSAIAVGGCSGEGQGDSVSEHVDAVSAPVTAASVTPQHANSPIYQAYQASLRRRSGEAALRAAPGGPSDTLATYAARCDVATGIHVPSFTCGNGTEVPGQTPDAQGKCLKPNVLNHECDPGSRFQVLPGQTSDAVAVAHCRKDGLPATGNMYNDIAVIQYNKKNGAVCFYQALTNLNGNSVPSPSSDSSGFWIEPAVTEQITCTGCHNNGGFIRSPYLAQLVTPPGQPNLGATSHLPSTADGYDNLNTPLGFVGLDFATNRTWSVSTTKAAGDSGPVCTTCHRMAVSNQFGLGSINGSGAELALIATAATQESKVAHSASSPIWMRPGQVKYGVCSNNASLKCNTSSECASGGVCTSGAEATANRFNNCSTGFWSGQPTYFQSGTPVAGCTFSPLGAPWAGFSPAEAATVLTPIWL